MIARVELRGLSRITKVDACKALRTMAGQAIDERTIHGDAKELWKSGLFDDVSVASRRTPTGRALTFVVRERPLVHRWTIHGAQGANQERVVATFPKPGQLFDPETLREGVARVREDYAAESYRRVEVQFKVRDAPSNEVDVDVTIDEGPRALVQAIVFRGLSQGKESELRALIDTGQGSFNAPGKPYRHDALERDRMGITSYYLDRGMVEVSVAEEEVALSADGTSATLEIEVTEGPVYRLGKPRCSGDLAGSEKKCLELLGLKKGDVFRRSEVVRGIERIRAFQEANRRSSSVEPLTTVDEKGNTVDLTISIPKDPV